jgi:hypothetical protein
MITIYVYIVLADLTRRHPNLMEESIIRHMNIGFNWTYSIETEHVIPVENTRASAKTTEKFSIGGNAQTYEQALTEMVAAQHQVRTTANGTSTPSQEVKIIA